MLVATSADAVVGVDFGTLSARALVVRVSDGLELGTGTAEYRHGVMETLLAGTGTPLPPDWALQVPADYVEAIALAVREAVARSGVRPEQVVGIGTDFTACTVLPVLQDGTPLCELPEFRDRPHAYVKLWKHHAAQAQADRLTDLAHARHEPWIGRYGGRLSSEWELAKGLQLLEEDAEIYHRMDRWVEAADWIVWQLCGAYVRNVCTAGFKAARQDGSYPSAEYFAAADPQFGGFVDKLSQPISQLGSMAGRTHALGRRPARVAGRHTDLRRQCRRPCHGTRGPRGTTRTARRDHGHLDLSRDGRRSAGRSARHVRGRRGRHRAGLLGYEAGQSGVGDIFGAFVESFVPAATTEAARAAGRDIHEHLTELALSQAVGAHGLVALDWHSGNRSVLVDHDLSGVLFGLTLQTQPQDVYRALVEATAFGTRVIVDAFEAAGLPVVDFIAAGGLIKNPLVMQVYADVLRRPIHVLGSEQGPALGSAMHAAVAAGAFPDIRAAATAMGRLDRDVWKPDQARADAYDRLFAIYRHLHDHFGRTAPEMMHDLRAIRRAAARS